MKVLLTAIKDVISLFWYFKFLRYFCIFMLICLFLPLKILLILSLSLLGLAGLGYLYNYRKEIIDFIQNLYYQF